MIQGLANDEGRSSGDVTSGAEQKLRGRPKWVRGKRGMEIAASFCKKVRPKSDRMGSDLPQVLIYEAIISIKVIFNKYHQQVGSIENSVLAELKTNYMDAMAALWL